MLLQLQKAGPSKEPIQMAGKGMSITKNSLKVKCKGDAFMDHSKCKPWGMKTPLHWACASFVSPKAPILYDAFKKWSVKVLPALAFCVVGALQLPFLPEGSSHSKREGASSRLRGWRDWRLLALEGPLAEVPERRLLQIRSNTCSSKAVAGKGGGGSSSGCGEGCCPFWGKANLRSLGLPRRREAWPQLFPSLWRQLQFALSLSSPICQSGISL